MFGAGIGVCWLDGFSQLSLFSLAFIILTYEIMFLQEDKIMIPKRSNLMNLNNE